MKDNKLLARFHQGTTLVHIKEELKDLEPYTSKVSIWKNKSGTTKVLIEEFFDKYIEATDLYVKDEIKEFPDLETAFQFLNTNYQVELVDFE